MKTQDEIIEKVTQEFAREVKKVGAYSIGDFMHKALSIQAKEIFKELDKIYDFTGKEFDESMSSFGRAKVMVHFNNIRDMIYDLRKDTVEGKDEAK